MIEDRLNGGGVRRRVLAVARGDRPAEIVLAGGRVVDVFTGSVVAADVAVVNSAIAPGRLADLVVCSDLGLVDVERFELVPLTVGSEEV